MVIAGRFHPRDKLREHERFEELASLAAVGELSRPEHEEFLRHIDSCDSCRKIYRDSTAVAEAAFLVGSAIEEDAVGADHRYRRSRNVVARRLAPAPVISAYVTWSRAIVAASMAAVFAAGIYLGGVVLKSSAQRSPQAHASESTSVITAPPMQASPLDPADSKPSSSTGEVAALQHQLESVRNDKRLLEEKVTNSDRNIAALATQVEGLAQESKANAKERDETRAQLQAANNDLAQAQSVIQSDQATIAALRVQNADREAQFADLKKSVERERQLLSADREIRDIMTARDLHMVDVLDSDGKGHPKKAFGRAFYTQGKSLIFYAYDLPANKTADGKFVYAAWGSNSNKLNQRTALSLGVFYTDDQSQRRWVMKFDDPKVLEEIDTVFVTLEPAGRPFTAPTGKPILDAYFGTPPNHP